MTQLETVILRVRHKIKLRATYDALLELRVEQFPLR